MGMILMVILAVLDLPYPNNEVVVRVNPDVYPSGFMQGSPQWGIPSLDALNEQFDVEAMYYAGDVQGDPYYRSRTYLLITSDSIDVLQACEQYEQDPNVEMAFPNYQLELFTTPIKRRIMPQNKWQWWNRKINQSWASARGYNGSGVKIGILDTGVFPSPIFWDTLTPDPCGYGYPYQDIGYDIPDFDGSLWINPGEDLNSNGRFDLSDVNGVDDDLNGYVDDIFGLGLWFFDLPSRYPDLPWDDYCHGTFVYSVIGAGINSSDSISGIAPGAKIAAIKIGGAHSPYGCCLPWAGTFEVERGAIYAVNQGMDVVNMSFGAYIEPGDTFNELYWSLHPVLEAGVGHGVIFVAAAGNSCQSPICYPAWDRDVIAVGASAQDDSRATYSSYGEGLELVAPVGNTNEPGIWTYFKGCEAYYYGWIPYLTVYGTSFSSPEVAGAVALLLQEKSYPKNANRLGLVRDRLHSRAVKVRPDLYTYDEDGWNSEVGYGRLDLKELLSPPVHETLSTPMNKRIMAMISIDDTSVSENDTLRMPVHLTVRDTLVFISALWLYTQSPESLCLFVMPTSSRFAILSFCDCIECPGQLWIGYDSEMDSLGMLLPGEYHAWDLECSPPFFTPGKYVISSTNGCADYAVNIHGDYGEVYMDTFTVEVTPTGIREKGIDRIRLWVWNANQVQVFEKGILKVYDVSGRMVMKRSMEKGDRTVIEAPSGVYFAKFATTEGTITKKLVLIK